MASEAKPQRRVPVQARSERRVAAILDAAAGLLAEVGYDALTLTEVAQRSETGIGTLYHFFANKDELIDALVQRLANDLRTLPAFVLTPALADGPIAAFVQGLIEPLAAFAVTHPELPELMGRVAQRNPAINDEIARRLDRIIARRAPHLTAAERSITVRVTVEIVRAGVRLLAAAPARTRAPIAQEIRVALSGYLGARIGERR